MQIVYATDGSEGALAAARFLASLPLGPDSHIRIVTVIQQEEEEADGKPALDAACGVLSGSAARVTRFLRRGNAAEEILWEAEDEPTDLLVVGTHGRSALARFLLGSVAERVARHAPCPVLLARSLRGELDQVVLGVDGSKSSEWAAAWVQQFPLPPPCEIRLATVVTPLAVFSSRALLPSPIAEQVQALVRQERDEAKKRLEALAASFAAADKQVATEAHSDNPALDGLGMTVVTEVRSDDPAQGLLAIAEEQYADLIVVGSQGVSGIDHFLLGSVSEKVLRHARCSVLVVRQPTGEDRADGV